MLGIIKELILAEVKIDPRITEQICEKARPVENYGAVYNLTYNQSEPKVDDLGDGNYGIMALKPSILQHIFPATPIFAVIFSTISNPSKSYLIRK